MSSLKHRISSPLEAGTSILDSQNLPPYLTQALEYASKRLSRKALHITLLVIRKEYQLPCSMPPPVTSPILPSASVSSSPTSPDFNNNSRSSPPTSRFASPVAGLRSLVRRGTTGSIASISTTDSRSTVASPTWPLTPGSPGPIPRTPMTPHTPASVATNSTNTSTSSSASAGGPNPFGMRFIYTTPLDANTEKALHSTISKAERKFRTGTGWLPPASTASTYGLNADLVRRSIRQNEVLFSSEGLTLLGLDRLYTFKSALAAYARTTLPPSSLSTPISSADSTRIEDAVDELRRLVLANGGRQVPKAHLHRTYEWIGVSASALGDVERMYRRAYGGLDRTGAFETPAEEQQQQLERGQPHAVSSLRTPELVIRMGKAPSPKIPMLKLQTSFLDNNKTTAVARKPIAIRPEPMRSMVAEEGDVMELAIRIDGLSDEEFDNDDENDGELTARPQAHGMPFWSSLDEMLQQEDVACNRTSRMSRFSRQSQAGALGPITPNGYDDISPITRGEWGFLFSGDSWKGTRTAAVETC